MKTVAPNHARPGPLETRQPELSRNIKFEENRAWKDLQTAARREDQKTGKRLNRLNEVAKVGG